jgi:hypothetical protein
LHGQLLKNSVAVLKRKRKSEVSIVEVNFHLAKSTIGRMACGGTFLQAMTEAMLQRCGCVSLFLSLKAQTGINLDLCGEATWGILWSEMSNSLFHASSPALISISSSSKQQARLPFSCPTLLIKRTKCLDLQLLVQSTKRYRCFRSCQPAVH